MLSASPCVMLSGAKHLGCDSPNRSREARWFAVLGSRLSSFGSRCCSLRPFPLEHLFGGAGQVDLALAVPLQRKRAAGETHLRPVAH